MGRFTHDPRRSADAHYLGKDPLSGVSGSILAFVKARAGHSILDFGCGTGGYAAMLQRSGFDDVSDRAVFFVDNVDDTERADVAGIERLPTRGRIEGGAIKGDEEAIAAVADALDRRLKRPEIRVGVVEALGHRAWTTCQAESASGNGPP